MLCKLKLSIPMNTFESFSYFSFFNSKSKSPFCLDRIMMDKTILGELRCWCVITMLDSSEKRSYQTDLVVCNFQDK